MSEEVVRDLFVTGLRNARALEHEAQSIMQRQIERIENYPDVLARLKEHQVETEAQIQRLDAIFTSIDESPSSLKETVMSFMGNMAALGHTIAPDEIIKNSFANQAFENFEIASYRSLITLAEAAGHTSHISALRLSLSEEQAMAKWLDDNVENVTRRFVTLSTHGASAKI